MQTLAFVARGLAQAFLAGPWQPRLLYARGVKALGKRPRWLRMLVTRVSWRYPQTRPPTLARLATCIRTDARVRRSWERGTLSLRASITSKRFAPDDWNLPQIDKVAQLADWLGLSIQELDWFADRRWLEAKTPAGKLRHYHYRWLSKRHGQARLIESPKSRLKALQRQILHEILDHIPTHPAAHGFVARRSIKSFVAPHVGQRVVLKVDLTDFFPTITLARIMGLFLTAGYPEQVALLLAALCCNVAPGELWDSCPADRMQAQRLRALYRRPHLPQGAPTSPALANLCAYHLDGRLSGLAGAAGAAYTRYADDLVFSGDATFARAAKRFHCHVVAVALDEGFDVNTRKTRIMRQGARQQAAGVILNVLPNVPRDEFDQLKATLFNSIRSGPASQNREQHLDFRAYLAGRIGFIEMLHPLRGQKLRRLFDAIPW